MSEREPERPGTDWSEKLAETYGDRDELFQRMYDPETAERDYKPIHPEPLWREVVRKLWAPIAIVGALLLKFKAAIFVVFKFKLFTVAGSMLVSIAAYALFWGWAFGVGFVLLLLVHELGHVIELRRQGVPASAPLFIPFMGAVVGIKQMPKNAWKEAQVALAGPILGSIGAAAVWAYGEASNSEFLIALAFVGFFINLFNLLPIVPLDGGRAVAAIHPAIWLVGLVALAGLAIVSPNPIILFILFIGGMELWNRWRARRYPEGQDYYRVEPWQRWTVAIVYLGLAALLVLAMGATHIEKDL